MYQVYTSANKSLVFPVMCDGFLKIDYEDNIADTQLSSGTDVADVPYGIWGDYKSFSIEAIITPYDINGNSASTVLDSVKTLPNVSSSESTGYLSDSGRLSHSMMIISNSSFSLYLTNDSDTVASSSDDTNNIPAKYKISFAVKLGSTTTIATTSSPVITGVAGIDGTVEAPYVFTPSHIIASFDNVSKQMSIYLNGNLVNTTTHAATDSFSMSAEDIYLGTVYGSSSLSSSALTRRQFMGEYHELAVYNKAITNPGRRYSIVPKMDDTLLYLRFEEDSE